MEGTKYYQVKVQVLQEDGVKKNGDVKFKKVNEVYLVKSNDGKPEEAHTKVIEDMKVCPYEWKITQISESSVCTVIDE